MALVSCFLAFGSIEPSLANYLKAEFGYSQSVAALVFCLPTVAYPIAAVLLNKLSRFVVRKALLMIGMWLITLAALLIGPVDWLQLSPHLLLEASQRPE